MVKRIIIITLALVLLIIVESQAQLNPLTSIYYQNEYLINPSLIGEDQRTNLNFSLKKQWFTTEGSPSIQAISVDHGLSEKIGIGGSITNEKAGLIKKTRGLLSLAYRLPISGYGDILSIGMGAGIYHESLDWDKFKGDQNDISFSNFNDRPAYLDADLGLAYENNGFKIHASIPNAKRFLLRDVKRSVINRSTFYSSMSYRIVYDYSQWFDYIETKIAYRGVEGYKGLFDVGFNMNFLGGDLIFNSMYHSSKSLTFGAGTILNKSVQLIVFYTSNIGEMQNYNNGEFEVGVKYSIFGNKSYSNGSNADHF